MERETASPEARKPGSPLSHWLQPFLGQVVIADLDELYLVIGTLAEAGEHHLLFTDADLHDHREANSTKEVYALESRQIGVRVNRKQVAIPRARLVAISRLDDLCA
jgi:hypothetical protein